MVNVIGNLTNEEILALTIYGEARGEPIEGQVAVANVIKNRVISSKNKDFKDICLAPKQFSCWNEHDPNRVLLLEIGDRLVLGSRNFDIYFNQCLYLAHGIIHNFVMDNTHGAKNYLTHSLFYSPNKPNWAKNVKNYRQIGNQIFFNAI